VYRLHTFAAGHIVFDLRFHSTKNRTGAIAER
jgi:hypothetical protein